jgi:hypothetical protein
MLKALLHYFLLPGIIECLPLNQKYRDLSIYSLFSYSFPQNNLLLNGTKADNSLYPLLPSQGTLDTSFIHLQVKMYLMRLDF